MCSAKAFKTASSDDAEAFFSVGPLNSERFAISLGRCQIINLYFLHRCFSDILNDLDLDVGMEVAQGCGHMRICKADCAMWQT